MSQNRNLGIDLLKIMSCFFVIVFHTTGYMRHLSEPLYVAILSVTKIAVAMFLLSSGAVLLRKEDDYKKLFKRIFRIAIPLLAINVIDFLIINYNNLSINSIGTFLKNIVQTSGQNNYHLYYLYLLMGIYLLLPLLRKAVASFTNKDYIFCLIVLLGIPSLMPFLSWFGIHLSGYFFLLNAHVGLVIAGHYINNVMPIKDVKESLRTATYILVSSVLLNFCVWMFVYSKNGEFGEMGTNIALPIMTIQLSLFFICSKIKITKGAGLIRMMSGSTFGIFLLHIAVQSALMYFINTSRWLNFINPMKNLWSFGAHCIVIFLLSFMITYCLKLIPGVKKFL